MILKLEDAQAGDIMANCEPLHECTRCLTWFPASAAAHHARKCTAPAAPVEPQSARPNRGKKWNRYTRLGRHLRMARQG
ncbi:MAG: hypothetical protein PVS2B1_17100 [Candidatus Dormibacteraceae bacterium]